MCRGGLVCFAMALTCTGVSCTNESDEGSGVSECEWRRVETRTEEGCGEPNPQCTVTTFDEQGFEVGRYIDKDCDGTKDIWCETYELDAMGRKIATRREDDCDGIVNRCTEYTYAANGEVSSREDDCNGGLLRCEKHLLDAFGHELSSEGDSGCDGAELCHSASYDEQGRTLRSEYGCGTPPDTCLTFEYSADGTSGHSESDDGCDGVPEECTEHTYDAEGHLLRSEDFLDCTMDAADSCTETPVDEHGNRIGLELDFNCDGTPDNCAYFKYECFE